MSEDLKTDLDPAGEAGEDMHVHKPKAAHSVREFLSEISVIVVGILIALTGEQLVEAVHRGAEVREAREALREEMRADSLFAVYGIEEDKCLRVQLDAFAAWARGGPKPPAYLTQLPGLVANNWDTVKSSAVPLMPLHERLAIAEFYDTLNNAQKTIEGQRANALVLSGASERQALSQEDAAKVLDAVAASRLFTTFHTLSSKSLLRQAAGMGVKPPPLSPDDHAEIALECGHSGSNHRPSKP